MAVSGATNILEMRGISKSFPGVKALDDVAFTCRAGEVHALVGENGAGKSTLMKILAGVYQPDAGEILLRGAPVQFASARAAQASGISIIYQEFNLIPYMTVAENIMLGREPHAPLGMVHRKQLQTQAKRWLDILSVEINLRRRVEELPVAQQQIVEIVKAMSYDAEILVMDEPTAALAPHEVANLFRYIATLKERGKTIVFISHRLDEVLGIADSITILKDGAVVTTRPAQELTKDEIVRLMVGREIKETFPPRPGASAAAPVAAPVLELKDVTSARRLQEINLTVRQGEVVGVAGLEGQGQRELARILFGLEPLSAGEILLNGQRIDLSSPRAAMRARIAFVSDDRKGEGLQLPLTIRRNISLPSLAS